MIGSRSAYTRKRIIDAATRLFAQKGDRTSLREITAEARVNLSAVNYHFGSKEGLIQAVCENRLNALNQEQLAMLDLLEAQASHGMAVEPLQIVEAYFRPLLRYAMNEPFLLLGQQSTPKHSNTLLQIVILKGHAPVLDRFRMALLRAQPDMPGLELIWRLLFMLGAASSTVAGMDGLLIALDRSSPEPFHPEMLIERLMPFLAHGLTAPLPETAPAQ